MILILCSASTGASAARDSTSVYGLDGHSCRPCFIFCALLRRAPAPIVIPFFHNASTSLNPARISDIALRIAGHFSFSLLYEYNLFNHCLPSAAVTIIYPLLQLLPPATCSRYLHLLPEAVTTTLHLLLLPSTAKINFVCCCTFLSLVRLRYTSTTSYSCVLKIH